MVVVLTLLGLAGCAATPSAPPVTVAEQDNAVLAKRAAQRWQLLLAGKLDDAYGFLSPGQRSLLSRDQYRSEIKTGLWHDAKIEDIECSASDVCKVKVMVSYEFKGKLKEPLQNTRPLVELWRRQDGEWWFVQTE